MSTIVIAVSLVFFYAFVKQDQKEFPSFSARLWLPLLWLLLTSTTLLDVLFLHRSAYDASERIEAYVEGNPISRYTLLALTLLGLMVLLKRKTRHSTIIRSNGWLFAFYFYTLLSAGWSEYQDISIKRWIKIFGTLIMALVIVFEDNYQEAFEHVIRRYVFICLTLSVVFVKFFSHLGFSVGRQGSRVWTGVAPGKNALGMLCTVSLLFLAWRLIKTRPVSYFDVLSLLMGAYLLIRAGSATAIVLTVIGLALLYGVSVLKIPIKKMALLTAALFLAALGVLSFFTSSAVTEGSNLFFKAIERDPSLTGRVPLWEDLLRIGSKHPISGSGYESFWLENIADLWEKYAFGPINAHNGYVDLYLNLGIIGVAIFMILIVKLLARLFTESALSTYYGQIAFVFCMINIIRNITESSLMNASLSWFLLLFFLIDARVYAPNPDQA